MVPNFTAQVVLNIFKKIYRTFSLMVMYGKLPTLNVKGQV